MTALKQYLPRAVNRVLDPTFESGVASAQASNNGALYVLTYDTTIVQSGARSALLTRSASTPSTTLGSISFTPAQFANVVKVPVTPGEVISFGCFARCSVAHMARMSYTFRDASNVNVGSNTLGPNLGPFGVGTWDAIKFENITVPAGAAFVILQCAVSTTGGNSVGGELCWFDSGICVTGATLPSYFDGNTAGCSWSGTPHQSQSVRAVQTPWTLWNGTTEAPLDPTQWNGSAALPVDLRDVSAA